MSRKVSLIDGKVVFEELEPETVTFEDRFKAALRDVRRDGVRVRQNVRGCCRSCISYEAFGMTDKESEITPLVWTYGGQGSAYRWIDGFPHSYPSRYYSGSGERLERIYFNHDGPQVIAATTLVRRMRQHGIEVEWDGSPHKCPEIIVPASEPEDGS